VSSPWDHHQTTMFTTWGTKKPRSYTPYTGTTLINKNKTWKTKQVRSSPKLKRQLSCRDQEELDWCQYCMTLDPSEFFS